MRSYLPCRVRGMRWSGASWSSVIHSGFMNMFQIKTFFPKLKTSDNTQKPYVGSFLWQKGQGWCYRLHPDLDWFFPVSWIHCMWKFSAKTQKLYIIIEAYFPLSWGGGGTIGCVSISSGSSEFFTHFSAQNFFPIPKIRKVHEKP